MVQNAALLAHAGGGNNHHGPVQIVELFRFGGIADVLQAAESERVLVVVEVGLGFGVETFRVGAVHGCHVDGERTVHKNRNVGDAFGIRQLMQQQDKLLGAADGECRHNNAPAALGGTVYHLGKFVGHVADMLVKL